MTRAVLCAVIVLLASAPLFAQEGPASWQWPDEQISRAVNQVRAGRDLTPRSWPGGARAAVLLSFDVDNETIWLRNGDTSIGGLSQGEYGSRVALGRVVDLLDEYEIPASFFWAGGQLLAGAEDDRADSGVGQA